MRLKRVMAVAATVVVGVPIMFGFSSGATNGSVAGDRVDRVAGADRYQTAVEVAVLVGGGSLAGLDRLIVVSGESFPDGLAASGLAGFLDDGGRSGRTAILLTQSGVLPPVVADAIRASGVPADRILIVGGVAAVSDAVRSEIAAAAGWDGAGVVPVTRIAGQDRYETAAAIVDYVLEAAGDGLPASYRTVLVANGERFPDALAGGTLAYRNGHLIVLSPSPSAPQSSLDAVGVLLADCAILLGGQAALSGQVGGEVGSRLVPGGCGVDRIGGPDRYETAALIANRFVALNGPASQVLLVSGVEFADALTAAPLAGGNRPMLLTGPTQLPQASAGWLRANRSGLNQILVVGGVAVVPPVVVSEAVAATQSDPDPTPGPTPPGPTPPGPTPPPPLDDRFILVLDVPDDGRVDLPLGGTVDVLIDWNLGGEPIDDCPTSSTTSGEVRCDYPVGGEYAIAISRGPGDGPWLTAFEYWSRGDRFLIEIASFGDLGLVSLEFAFGDSGADQLVKVPSVLPASVRNASYMFFGATALNDPNIGLWDVSNVTNMAGMFIDAEAFNQDLSGWDVSSVVDMEQMFSNAFAFNNGCDPGVYTCPLTWMTTSLTDISNMFRSATVFNQYIGGWDTSAVTKMWQTFDAATAFNNGCAAGVTDPNCALGWNTGAVTLMLNMFNGASAFNQNIGTWDTSSVLNNDPNQGAGAGMRGMFNGASVFNQNLSGWCVTNIPTLPTNFDTGANAWGGAPGTRPQWGNCPS